MTVPVYTPDEAQSRETFLALMWALSYPGRVYTVPTGGLPFLLIGETLLDLETSYYTPDSALDSALAQTGARKRPVAQAAYHFYPGLSDRELEDIAHCSTGTPQFPDEAATLLIGCHIGQGELFTLRGPGVREQQMLQLDGIPAMFWMIRESACQYPLGWDVYFVDEQRIAGLPRSVQVGRSST